MKFSRTYFWNCFVEDMVLILVPGAPSDDTRQTWSNVNIPNETNVWVGRRINFNDDNRGILLLFLWIEFFYFREMMGQWLMVNDDGSFLTVVLLLDVLDKAFGSGLTNSQLNKYSILCFFSLLWLFKNLSRDVIID